MRSFYLVGLSFIISSASLLAGEGTGWVFENSQWGKPGTSAPAAPDGLKLADAGKALYRIALPDSPTVQEETAAKELAHYLNKITGAIFEILPESQAGKGPTIFVGSTKATKALEPAAPPLGEEQWRKAVRGDNLYLYGGFPRGTLYAVYTFLENELGVHWWTRSSETVPRSSSLTVSRGERSGQPAFYFREISQYYNKERDLREVLNEKGLAQAGGFYDGGRFAARNRLTGQGNACFIVAPEFGGQKRFVPPSAIHTFYWLIPPEKYFAPHPEWFSLVDGKRRHVLGQLDLMNPELRAEYLKNLRENISKARAEGAGLGYTAYGYADVSANDWEGYDEGPASRALVQKEGTEMAPILDFANYLADNLKTEFPEVNIRTLAYKQTEPAPKTMRARDDVIVTLTDTISNPTRPMTAPGNGRFLELLKSWKDQAKQIWIWDYANAYGVPEIFAPAPVHRAIFSDIASVHKLGAVGMKVEQGDPLHGDDRDILYWMLIKAMEDPSQDYDKLLVTFTDGYFGPAAPYLRDYYKMLEKAAAESGGEFASAFSIHLPQMTYLTPEVIENGHVFFDQAEAAVQNATPNPEALMRVRQARRALDEATVRFSNGQSGKAMVMPRAKESLSRYRETQLAAIETDILPAHRDFARQRLEQSLLAFQSVPPSVSDLPPELRDQPGVYLYQPGIMAWRRGRMPFKHKDGSAEFVARMVRDDTGTSSGEAIEVKILKGADKKFEWSMVSQRKTLKTTGELPLGEVGKEYKWFRLGECGLSTRDVAFFFSTKDDPAGVVYLYSDFYSGLTAGKGADPRAELWVRMRKGESASTSEPLYYISGAALKSL